ncbi:protein trichome birefringence-like 2 [Ziziphus jujuba]|uniref:Protein trichome birefringence-like 2 n=1 Tax=Ziziphus jujuba TaxID=326968 RepID=A0A6P4B7R8_ZIZJJ|nr:protein trichome birefringence-like 2 [Ziziphus jujuba]XP_048322860.1 protein trichome birefringence-like 2 [Ziziphus jujuba var. spinosa]
MNFKKQAFPEQFLWPRKVLSGFGLGVVVTVFVLALLMFNSSLRAPVEPILQGFQSFRAKSVASNSSSFSGINSVSTSELQKSGDLVKKFGDGKVMDKTHVENVSQIPVTEKFEAVVGEILVSEKTHSENFTEQVKNGSFTVERYGVQEQTHQVNGSVVGNVSFSGKENLDEGQIISGASLKNPGTEADKEVRENNNVSNILYNAEVGTPLLEGKNESETNRGGNSIQNDKTNISNYSSQFKKMQSGSYEECDIFDGKWVRDDSKPYYPQGSCPYIDKDFDCHLNGRPDDGYLKWRWQPNGCDIPRLNATDFLEKLRGKKLVFVGDSLNRNMWESLVCILRHSLRYKKRVYEISGKSEFKKKGIYAFRFEDYNCSVDFVASPFLVRESTFTGRNGTFETLRLDLMDQTTSMYHDADIIVFNTGHWWTHEKTSKGEDYYQEGNYVHPRLKVLKAYQRALTTWARWVDKNIDANRTLVLFRGYSVTHFRGGQWNSGGQCHKETEPIFNESFLSKYPSKMRALDHVLQEMRTPVVYLNISRLTDCRKDGHPSIYRMKYKTVEEQIAAERSQDCSHWCLPGVPDTWNELLYASFLNARRGSWIK